MPVPVNACAVGELAASLENESVADAVPATAGLNTTLNDAVCPGARMAGREIPESANSLLSKFAAEIVSDDAVLALERRLGIGRRRNTDHLAFGTETERAVAQAEALDRVDEARRPAAAPELAVGDARQADRFLEPDDVPDRFVLR